MSSRKKKSLLWVVLAAVFLLAAVALCAVFLRHSGAASPTVEAQTEETSAESAALGIPVPSLEPPKPSQTVSAAEEPAAEMASVSEAEEAEEEAPYESPVDFEAIWAVNEDVRAWLYIPGADLSLPILQHPTDNAYYLTHDVQRQSSSSGALFIEDYNNSDFTDMCTVVYGHRMYSGEMFGTLQAVYSDAKTFAESQTIVVYLPDREIVYQVFAAAPYDDSHILYYNDFSNQLSYRKFINGIYSSSGVGATLAEDLKPQYGDKLLILSTCLWGDKDNRYLVLAKERTA